MSDSNNQNPANLPLESLLNAKSFDYDGRTWLIKEFYEYRWYDDDSSTIEYEVNNQFETFYLCLDSSSNEDISWVKEVKSYNFIRSIKSEMKNNYGNPPKRLTLEGTDFIFAEKAKGKWMDDYNESEELTNWDYYDQRRKKILSIERWSDNSIEVFVGDFIPKESISNIVEMPKSSFPKWKINSTTASIIFWCILGAFLILINNLPGCSSFSSSSSKAIRSAYVPPSQPPDAELDVLLNTLIKKYDWFVFMLYDMDYQIGKPMHRYRLIYPNNSGMFKDSITDWEVVSPEFFLWHQHNLGLELASTDQGAIRKKVQPAGFSHFIGNENYGDWEKKDTNEVWKFKQNLELEKLLYLDDQPAIFSMYYHFEDGVSVNKLPVIGNYYGTLGYGLNAAGRASLWLQKDNLARDKIISRVRQQAYAKQRTQDSIRYYRRTPRNSSRYSNSYRSRSRSSGSGGK